MTAPDAQGRGSAGWRLAGAGLLAAGVAAVLYVTGRLHQPDYTFSMFGADPFPPKSLLATIALVLAGLQALLALWIYRRLPLAGNMGTRAGWASSEARKFPKALARSSAPGVQPGVPACPEKRPGLTQSAGASPSTNDTGRLRARSGAAAGALEVEQQRPGSRIGLIAPHWGP